GWHTRAIAAYDRAIEIDPGFAGAYARRSIARQLTREGRAENDASNTLAKMDFELALALNPDNADALAAAGLYESDPDQADRLLRRALEIDPDLPNARSWYTTNLKRLGRFREANEIRAKHLSLDPLNPLIHTNSIVTRINQGDYNSAKGLALEAFLFPDESFGGPYHSLFSVEMAFGEYARGLAWILEALLADSDPNSNYLLLAHADVSAVLGMFEEAHQQTDLAVEKDRSQYETRLKILFRQDDRSGLKMLTDTLAEDRDHRRIPFSIDQHLGSLYLQLGEIHKAIDYLKPTFEGFNGVPLERSHFGPQDDAMLYLVKAFLLAGREKDAHLLLRDLDDFYALMEREGVAGTPNRLVLMALHKALSDRENEAFLLLGRAIDRGWADYYALVNDARWDGLRDNPEFIALLAEAERELALERELVINHRQTDSLDVVFASKTYQTATLIAH
ncbi:MAG: hypothetical protein O7G86_02060, partial [Gammaproteobacteria bacterium]|nr:hypothetical protein [Gammaproteobacteria bacterium]